MTTSIDSFVTPLDLPKVEENMPLDQTLADLIAEISQEVRTLSSAGRVRPSSNFSRLELNISFLRDLVRQADSGLISSEFPGLEVAQDTLRVVEEHFLPPFMNFSTFFTEAPQPENGLFPSGTIISDDNMRATLPDGRTLQYQTEGAQIGLWA